MRATEYYHTVYHILQYYYITYRYQKIQTILATRISLRGKPSSTPHTIAVRLSNRICFS